MKATENTRYLSDDAIIDLYWQRDESAIAATDKKYRKYLYAIAYNIVHEHTESEDCLNDTYMRTWDKIPPTRPNILQAFLAKITRNTAVDSVRRSTASTRIPSELTVSLSELDECIYAQSATDSEAHLHEIIRILNEYLHTLSDRMVTIFICRYYYADTISRIAKIVGSSERTVQRDLSLMRRELRMKLKEGGYGI